MSRLSGAVGRISGYVPGWLDRTTIAQSTLVGIAAVLGSYAIAGFTPALVTAPIESFLVTWMPGVVITFAITVLGDLGKKLNLVTAIGLGIGGFAAASFIAIKMTRRSGRSSSSSTGVETDAATTAAVPLVVGGATLAMAFALTSEVGSSMGAGIAAGAIAGVSEVGVGSGSDSKRSGRRRLLRSGGTLALGGAGAYVLGSRGGLAGNAEIESNPDITQPSDLMEREEVTEGVASRLDEAEDKSLRVRGIEPLVSDNFYRTDINNTVPTPDVEGWELSITGAVQSEQTYDFENLGSFDPQHRFISLRCVGENLNGNKMDNAIWTGVPIEPLLEQANPQADFVMAHAVDGYSVGFPREELEGAFLAYGMNGERLPREHGYPVRLLVPGNWGEVNVKWIDKLEIQDEEENGYWEKKGWKGTGEVKTVAKIKSVNKMNDRVEVAGHAYAGTRGVSAVEISIDGGDSWKETTLSEPLPGQDVWRQWKHVYYNPGDHEVIARAIEEDGTVQSSEETGSFPSGPSGWVSRSV
jgi:DMSO/TMAO reductase YedYZ molybdopterin-dependent catalytic subunit